MVKLLVFVLVGSTLGLVLANLHVSTVAQDRWRSGNQSQTFLDRNGQTMRSLLNEDSERMRGITLNEVPSHLITAVLVSEDRRFYEHFGIDLTSFARVLRNFALLKNSNGVSTINMQLSRILFPELRSWPLKPLQFFYAIALDIQFSKDELLIRYLNEIPYGRQVTGVAEACLYFFKTECHSISLSQAAVLSVIPKNPSRMIKDSSKLFTAKNYILKKMSKETSIEGPLLNSSLREGVELAKVRPTSESYHFTEFLRRSFPNALKSRRIKTTLDLNLQRSLQAMLKNHIHNSPSLGDAGSILVLDNPTGEVLAYVGGPDFYHSKFGKFDFVQSLRSPGSTLKPFVYALALQNGKSLSSLLLDMPSPFTSSKGVHIPTNYGGDFSGPIQLRYALGNSRNLPVLKLTQEIGEGQVLSTLRMLGFRELSQDSEHYGVGISLGNGEVSLFSLANAYRALANGGKVTSLKFLENQIPEKSQRVFSEPVAYQISDVLMDPEARAIEFGSSNWLEFDIPLSVKTGTSSAFRDHWIVGYNKKFTVAIWKGNADSSPISKRVSSISGAGRLFHEIVERVIQDYPAQAIPEPEGLVTRSVCTLSGDLAGPNCAFRRWELYSDVQGPESKSVHTCQFHKTLEVKNCDRQTRKLNYIDFPEELKEWGQKQGYRTLEVALKSDCKWSEDRAQFFLANQSLQEKTDVRIVEPADGTILGFDPSIPKSHQKLRIQLSSFEASKGFHLKVGDTKLQDQDADGSFLWPVQRGKFELQMVRGEDPVGEIVRIEVR
jgi:penicillin-binding protein 1C